MFLTVIRLLLLWVWCLAGIAQAGQDRESEVSSASAVTVCDVLARPQAFNGTLVRIRGVWNATDESSLLVANDCGRITISKNRRWPFALSLEAPQPNREYLHAIKFEFDWQSLNNLQPKYLELKKRAPVRCIQWVFTGLFETVLDEKGDLGDVGFGHLGAAPGRLLIRTAAAVFIEPGCK
jgi:hypothetical protein